MRVNAKKYRTPSALWNSYIECSDLATYHQKRGYHDYAVFWMQRANYYETLYWQAFDQWHSND